MIVADFLSWCAEPTRPRMDPGRNDPPTHPMGLSALYVQCDYWTRMKLGDAYDYTKIPYGNRLHGGYPPLVSADDITRTAHDICRVNFGSPYGYHPADPADVGPLYIPTELMDTITKNLSPRHDESPDLFIDLMWWIIVRLDDYFGEDYMTTHILRRPIYETNSDVRVALVEILQIESRLRLRHAGVRLDAARMGVRLDESTMSNEDDNDIFSGVEMVVELHSSDESSE